VWKVCTMSGVPPLQWHIRFPLLVGKSIVGVEPTNDLWHPLIATPWLFCWKGRTAFVMLTSSPLGKQKVGYYSTFRTAIVTKSNPKVITIYVNVIGVFDANRSVTVHNYIGFQTISHANVNKAWVWKPVRLVFKEESYNHKPSTSIPLDIMYVETGGMSGVCLSLWTPIIISITNQLEVELKVEPTDGVVHNINISRSLYTNGSFIDAEDGICGNVSYIYVTAVTHGNPLWLIISHIGWRNSYRQIIRKSSGFKWWNLPMKFPSILMSEVY